MPRKALVCLSALGMAATTSCLAADPVIHFTPPACPPIDRPHRAPRRISALPAPVHNASIRRSRPREILSGSGGDSYGPAEPIAVIDPRVSVAWGMAPGLGQLGAYGTGYFAVHGCWTYQPAYDRNGDYLGQPLVNICVDLPP
jgi:hypothetical protein